MEHPLASLWCAHPRIHSGEAFSSWLHRSAYANGMADHTFCRHLLGDRTLWNRDVDHLASPELLAKASAGTGELYGRLMAGTLNSLDGVFFQLPLRSGHFPWILSLGVYHRLRRRHGQQYCAACLREAAWAKLEWRYAWAICCTRHACLLHDACPECDAPFNFHRLSLATPGRLQCHACGTNLLQPRDSFPATQRQMRFQQRLMRASMGEPFALGNDRIMPTMLFAGLRVLARGIYSTHNREGLVATMQRTERMCAPRRPPMNIEHWRLKARVFALSALQQTLVDWPRRFIHSARRARIYRCRFDDRYGKPAPAWLEDVLALLERR